MYGFLRTTFTRQKFAGLFVNTALGNFAGYFAGSLVTVISTRHTLERRGVRNLFGVLHRKKIVVHVLPHWLEWLLALIAGFLVMEAVRYWFNHRKYAALLNALRPERRPESAGHASDRIEAAGQRPAGDSADVEALADSKQMNLLETT